MNQDLLNFAQATGITDPAILAAAAAAAQQQQLTPDLLSQLIQQNPS